MVLEYFEKVIACCSIKFNGKLQESWSWIEIHGSTVQVTVIACNFVTILGPSQHMKWSTIAVLKTILGYGHTWDIAWRPLKRSRKSKPLSAPIGVSSHPRSKTSGCVATNPKCSKTPLKVPELGSGPDAGYQHLTGQGRIANTDKIYTVQFVIGKELKSCIV